MSESCRRAWRRGCCQRLERRYTELLRDSFCLRSCEKRLTLWADLRSSSAACLSGLYVQQEARYIVLTDTTEYGSAEKKIHSQCHFFFARLASGWLSQIHESGPPSFPPKSRPTWTRCSLAKPSPKRQRCLQHTFCVTGETKSEISPAPLDLLCVNTIFEPSPPTSKLIYPLP